MKSTQAYRITIFVLFFLLGSSKLFAQLEMTVNSLEDDENSFPYDNPDTDFDESTDGICEDDLGRCTIRAAIEESINMSMPAHITFSVSGTIDLVDILYPQDGSVIQGSGNIELAGLSVMEIDNRCTIGGIQFNSVFNAIAVTGSGNIIGINNTFINSYTALIIEGDSNSVVQNRFGLDTNNELAPNLIGISVLGSHNYFSQNTVCGNLTGISITEGEYSDLKYNFIGTTTAGDLGYGNIQGIVIGGSGLNLIGGEFTYQGNVISGNTTAGIVVSGVPPDDYSVSNSFWNNIIGLDPTQSYAIPNENGIIINNGARIAFMGRNIIAGNSQNGIFIFGYDDETLSYGHTIAENRIGINSAGEAFPNGFSGISITGNVQEVTIGTGYTGNHLPNTIAANSGYGIYLTEGFGYSPSKITVRKNLVYQNNSANLYVSPSSNNGLTTPHSLTFSNSTIAGINNTPNVLIDIYKSDINESSPSAYQWIGSTTAGSNGIFSYEISDVTVESVSVTATTSIGNTSGFSFLELITSIAEEDQIIPSEFSMEQNYPNPFNPITTIKYSIAKAGHVTMTVFNIHGGQVARLINGDVQAGEYSVQFQANNLASGVYFCTLETSEYVKNIKMMLIK